MPPLKLVDGKPGTFLENEFEIIAANTVRYWLKNEADANFAWKYAHADSHAAFAQKKATLIASLKKIDKIVSDKGALHHSAYKKLGEFLRLGYPKTILKKACARVAWETSNQNWISIRNLI